jgi:hypothetical protein
MLRGPARSGHRIAAIHALRAVLFMLFLVGPGQARADPVLAETSFREGKALLNSGDFVGAAAKFAESNRQDPASGTLLALALCQEKIGLTATAWGTYSAAGLRARQELRTDREEVARERVTELEATLSRLVVEVPADVQVLEGLLVKRDGQELPRAAWNSAVPVDPGEHTIEVVAVGKKPWKQSVRLGPQADRQSIRVPMLEDVELDIAPDAAPVPQPVVKVPHPPAPQARVAQRSAGTNGLKIAAIASGGLGIAAIGVGIGFGLKAKSLDERSLANRHCSEATGCDDAGWPLHRDAIRAATVSTLGFATGVVALGAGVTLFILGRDRTEETAASVVVRPVSGGGQLAAVGRF